MGCSDQPSMRIDPCETSSNAGDLAPAMYTNSSHSPLQHAAKQNGCRDACYNQ